MNNLPHAFYESVFFVGCTARGFVISRISKTAEELSGNIRIVAQQMTSMYKYHVVSVRNNRISNERRWNLKKEVPKHLWNQKDNFISTVSINIYENTEDKVSKEIIDRICFPNSVYYLALKTATVSKAWIDWACTAKRLKGLTIFKKLNDEAITLYKRVIETGRLTELQIGSEAFSKGVIDIMKLSLIQPQLKSLCLMKDGNLEELLAFWIQNKEALRGKDLYFENPHHARVLKERLELCSQEEFKPIGRYHSYFSRTLFRRPSQPYKLKYCGDDGYSAYVFFDCVERNPNKSEVSCLTNAPIVGILFT